MTSHTQISARLAGRSVYFHGMPIRLEDLCGANFILGSTGSGKTETIVEALSLALAAESAESPTDRAAMVFFAAKGSSHQRFLESLPPERREDVIKIGAESDSPFPLFSADHWSKSAERTAVTSFMLELARHAVHSTDTQGNHKTWFEGVLEDALAALSEATAQGPVDWNAMAREDPAVSKLFHRDALTGLIRRIDAAIDHSVNSQQKSPDQAVPPEGVTSTLFERWLARLTPHSQRRIRAFLPHLTTASASSGGFLLGEFNLLIRHFRSGPARDLLVCNKTPYAGTWEQVIDQGKIVIVDLPSVGSPQNRLCLIALAQSLMSTILRRARATNKGVPINQTRPIVVIADEFQGYLTSIARHSGLELTLSACREFGGIFLLATQTVSQLQGVYGDWTRVESLLANVRHVFVGQSTCALTVQWAEKICGTRAAASRPLMIDWHRDPAIAALADAAASEEPRVSGRELAQLRTGVFIVKTPDGRLVQVDARRELSAPKVTSL